MGGAVTATGSIAPGLTTGNGIGELKTGAVTWNGNAASSSATDWKFHLGAGNASDTLTITGDFTKGSGDTFWFDFLGSTAAGTFDLVTWTGSTTFTDVSVFDYTNLGVGYTGSFNISGNTLQFTSVIPEPATTLAGLLLAAGLLRRRRTA